MHRNEVKLLTAGSEMKNVLTVDKRVDIFCSADDVVDTERHVS